MLKYLPGVGALACCTGGAYLVWGPGVALLVAGVFLLLADLRLG